MSRRVPQPALVLGAVLLLVAACRDAPLQRASGTLQFRPASVQLDTYVGRAAQARVRVWNDGRAPLTVRWHLPGEPFEIEAPPATVPSGELELVVRFRPSRPGYGFARAVAEFGGGEAVLVMAGESKEVPACTPSSPCVESSFDFERGECVEVPLADGTSCEGANRCLVGASCQAGRCVGLERTCDDGNACTLDVCNPSVGCEHAPAPPCPGDGKCRLGVCDPRVGCTLAPAADGTRCGPTRTCDAVDVCIAGECVTRDPPDGYVCAPASPCQGEGRCSGSVCERPAAVALTPSWTFDSTAMADPPDLHDFVLEPDGAVSLMGFFEVPRFRADGANPVKGQTPARRCIVWNARLVCADYPYNGSGKVSAVDPATGQTQWTYDLPGSEPELTSSAMRGHVFMARVATLGSDRLAALFEAYPSNAQLPTNCRQYFLAVLDTAGRSVSAVGLKDPLLEACNHPHPYGVASDIAGNLFLAFSPSQSPSAPLLPTSPTLLMSFSRDGVFRWKRTETFVGGELAVARGRLYAERATVAFSTLDGSPWTPAEASGPFGRVVVTGEAFVPSPIALSSSLAGYDLRTGARRWTYSAPGRQFWSEQIRLASWRSRPTDEPMTVALFFALEAEKPTLVAVDPRWGGEEWSCPISHTYRTPPQLFEVARGSLVLMEGSDQCGNCDPPFAQSKATFHRFTVPGVDSAREPWVGTFGGAGHDHHEDAALPPSHPR